MAKFVLNHSWLKRETGGIPEIEATMSAIEIVVNDVLVTEHSLDGTASGSRVHVPAYYIAEWVAENWWPLLYEPRKNDEAMDPAYRSRHTLLSARRGFALPDLSLIPEGRGIRLEATPCDVPGTTLRFTATALADLEREAVKSTLQAIVEKTIAKLRELHVIGTPLEETWALVSGTDASQESYCQLLGALGLSPYDAHESIDAIIERIWAALGERLARDLCLGATPQSLPEAAETSIAIAQRAADASPIVLTPLKRISAPEDDFAKPGWRRGVVAARRVRSALEIEDTEPRGAERVFDRLRIDPTSSVEAAASKETPVIGAVAREVDEARFALLQDRLPSRRFGAARAAYLAWTAKSHDKRLITHAHTRDQQASRAFAAELLAPISYLRRQATNKALSRYRIGDIANDLCVSPDVVLKQALNNGIRVPQY